MRRFSEILADDFLCSTARRHARRPRRVPRKRTAQPVTIANLGSRRRQIRVMDGFAIVMRGPRTRPPTASQESGRYTDVWARRNGTWLAVSAHVTRG